MGGHAAAGVPERLHRARHLDRERALRALDGDAAARRHVGHAEVGVDAPPHETRLLHVGRAHHHARIGRPLAGLHASLPPRIVLEVGDEPEHLVRRAIDLDGVLKVESHALRIGLKREVDNTMKSGHNVLLFGQ